jgi:hypothetical protein
METTDSIGFLRYEGKLVEGGLLDAKSAARALNGFDSSLRHFVSVQRPLLATLDLPIPVKIDEGSWMASIPEAIGIWILSQLAIGSSSYSKTAGQKLAENDFKDAGLKDAFKGALKSIQWLFRLGIHLGHLDIKKVTEGLKWDEDSVGIPNAKGEFLNIPKSELKQLAECPPHLLADVASVIEVERSLVIGVKENGKIETVRVEDRERYIFYTPSSRTEVLFPELTHGLDVVLDGVVTRGNKGSNNLGFFYKGHVLNCKPSSGTIVRFKRHLFLQCQITGKITRADKKGNPTELRPQIVFSDLNILSETEQPELPLDLDDEEGG